VSSTFLTNTAPIPIGRVLPGKLAVTVLEPAGGSIRYHKSCPLAELTTGNEELVKCVSEFAPHVTEETDIVCVALTKTKRIELVLPALFCKEAVERVATLLVVRAVEEFLLTGSFATNHCLASINFWFP